MESETAEPLRVQWVEGSVTATARWRSEGGYPPKKLALADDTTRAAVAYHQACEGISLVYRGDYRNARQLLTAMAKQVHDRRRPPPPEGDLLAAFRAHRQLQSTSHQILSKLLVPLDEGYRVQLAHAPDVAQPCAEVWGPPAGGGSSVTPLRELLGMIGAHEWRKNGVQVDELNGRVHPHYGVFAPIRSEYVDLVAQAQLPRSARTFDLGTGTGVLALVLARRGLNEILACDVDPRAVACARDNVERFQARDQILVEQHDLFPEGRADLVVFNPPWIPEKPRSPMDRAIYDPDSKLLLRFLEELPAHLNPGGEGWLILSDLAEQLGLRPRGWLEQAVAAAGLVIRSQTATAPSHPRAQDEDDPLYAARSLEHTVLYRLGT